MTLPKTLLVLSEQFKKFPGVGDKTAIKFALFLIKQPPTFSGELIQAITEAKKTTLCTVCFNYACSTKCELCENVKRDDTVLCVVSEPRDLEVIEDTHEYKGRYHVLHGLISPMTGISPKDIKITELLSRLQSDNNVKEIILALDATVEGEATSLYITKFLKSAGFKVSRIAFGISAGVSLETVDPISMAQAIIGRKEL